MALDAGTLSFTLEYGKVCICRKGNLIVEKPFSTERNMMWSLCIENYRGYIERLLPVCISTRHEEFLNPSILSLDMCTCTGMDMQDLKDMDFFGKMDPYAIIKCGNQSVRTKTHTDGGRNPVWAQTFDFNIINENTVEVSVYDEDTMSRDDLIGIATVSLAKVREHGSDKMAAPVMTKKGKQHGFVHITLAFKSNSTLRPAGAHPQMHPQMMQPPYGYAPAPYPMAPGYAPQPYPGYAPAPGMAPQYGMPPPQYGMPPPQYGMPPPQYGMPPPQHGMMHPQQSMAGHQQHQQPAAGPGK